MGYEQDHGANKKMNPPVSLSSASLSGCGACEGHVVCWSWRTQTAQTTAAMADQSALLVGAVRDDSSAGFIEMRTTFWTDMQKYKGPTSHVTSETTSQITTTAALSEINN